MSAVSRLHTPRYLAVGWVLGWIALGSHPAALAQATAEAPRPRIPDQALMRPPPTPFDRHRVRVSLGLGGGSYGGNGYFALGGGVGYFVLPGLELGLDLTQWIGPSPNMTKLSPQLRYVAFQALRHLPVAPYVGAFYRHWFLWGGFSDFDTVGGRAGLILAAGQRAFLAAGVAYERILQRCAGSSCDSWYPEFSVAVVF